MRNLLLAVLVLNLAVPAFSAGNDQYSRSFYVPMSKNGVADVNLKNIRPALAYVEDSTVASLEYTGDGKLLGMCVSGGIVGGFAMAYDSSATTDISDANKPDADPSLLISPTVISPGTASSGWCSGSFCGCWFPQYPVPFDDGLVVVNSALDIVTLIFYMKD